MEKRKPQKNIFWYGSLGLAIAGGTALAYQGILWLLAMTVTHSTEAASVGIIGGADGPTAIYVTSAPGIPWDLITAGILLLIGIAGCIYFSRRHK